MEISDILRLVEQEREEAEVAKLLNLSNLTHNNSRRQSGSSFNYNTNYSRSASTTSSEGAEDEQPSSSVFMAPLSPISRPSKIKVGADPNPSSSGMTNLEIVQKIVSMPVGDFFSQGMQLTPEERAIEERNIVDMKRLQIEIETGGEFSVGDNLSEILCFGRVLSGYTECGVFSSSSGGESKFPGMRSKNLDLNSETSSPSAGNRKSKKKNKSKPKPRAKSLQHGSSEKHPVTTGISPNSSRVNTETVRYQQQDQNGGRYQSAKRKSAVGDSPKAGKQSKDIIMIEKTEMSQQSSSELLIQSIQRVIDKANADFKTPEEGLPVPVHLRDDLGIFKLTGDVSERNVTEIPSSDKFEYPHSFAAEVLHAIPGPPGPHVEDASIVHPYRSLAVAMLEVTDTGMGSFVAWNELEVELQTIVDEMKYRASKIDDLFGEVDAYFSRTINDLDLLI